MTGASARVYGGVAGEDRQAARRERLIEAGLTLLGSADNEPGLTVRGVCSEAGLIPRYFYESFADRDTLAIAVFDRVVLEVAGAALDAVERTDSKPGKVRGGLDAIVRSISEDPRRGRLLFSPVLNSTVLADRRIESTRMFVRLLRAQAREIYGVEESTGADLTADFLVGGMAQTLSSWLAGTLDVSEEEIVDKCTNLFLAAANAVVD